MIVLFTDFGIEGPYIGQLKRVIYQHHPGATIIDLFSDLPPCEPQSAAVLLAAYTEGFPPGSVFLAIVDPGVGMPARRGVVVKSNGCWFVGPDNGLFDLLLKRDDRAQVWEISWQPESLSNSFHGRDLFAPVAAEIAAGRFPENKLQLVVRPSLEGVGEDYPFVVYVDRFGNLISGIRSASIGKGAILKVAGRSVSYARTFGEVAEGVFFWYCNSNGLVEVAANRASAARLLGIEAGEPVQLQK